MPVKRSLVIAALGSASAVSVLAALWWKLGALIDECYTSNDRLTVDFDGSDLELDPAA